MHRLLLVDQLVACDATDAAGVAPYVDEGSPPEDVGAQLVLEEGVVDVNIITDYCEGPELGESIDEEVEVEGDQEALVLGVLLLQMSG